MTRKRKTSKVDVPAPAMVSLPAPIIVARPDKLPHESTLVPGRRLGKHPPKLDQRTLRLAKYLGPGLPPPPVESDWLSGVTDWGMMGNDLIGDCTIVSCAHAIQVWSAATGPMDTPTDAEVLQYYMMWDGYVPGDPSTDNGGIELDVLNRWRKEGFAGRELVAYADPTPGNADHIRQSIVLFGGVYIGLGLPQSAQDQMVWDYVPGPYAGPGSWGGHAVYVCAYDPIGLTCITWGARQRMTWEFWHAYCDEAHTLLGRTWLERAIDDFHLGDLQNDLQQVTG